MTPPLPSSGVVAVTSAIRRRQREPLTALAERCVQENVVRYDDEGGGEEDTEAFDMLALRPLHTRGQRHPAPARPLPSRAEPAPESSWLFLPLIRQRLQQAGLDSAAPPPDSLHTFALEGSGSSAASLSSLNSLHSSGSPECQPSYDLLKEWGPRFGKLADLYGQREGGGAAPQPSDYTCGTETRTWPHTDSCGEPGVAVVEMAEE